MLASDSESDIAVAVPPKSPPGKPVPVGPQDRTAQVAWEHYQVAKGIERYRRTLTRENKHGVAIPKSLEETTPGHRIASELIGPLVEAIQAKQVELAEELRNPKLAKVPDVTVALTTLPPDTLAACTVLTALANPVDASYTSVAVAAAARVRHELEYQAWKDAEAAAEKERKETGAEGVNLFKLMLRRNDGEVDKRAFDKWAKKADLFIKKNWDQDLKVRVGAALLELLVQSNGWFKVESVFNPQKGRASLMFGMTDSALALTSQLGAQCELQRPFMAPMICEPQDYEYLEPQVVSAAQK
ncbi:hypothetical protein [Ralstonia solanacearum]|uniref:hypothetical protein n=1 Tax=Ralstonia solanacearum TaxID=305 RepID=UPI0018D0937F|nr:hypothetical protein [Ralstonia solanacearum]